MELEHEYDHDIAPVITFKAGRCKTDFTSQPAKVTPLAEPGYIYLYYEDDLVHFCWRPRANSLLRPEEDLVMVPTDASFTPYYGPKGSAPESSFNGRVFVLKFSSSSMKYFFWLQSQAATPDKPGKFSQRDLRLGDVVNQHLQGEEPDMEAELANLRGGDANDGDEDETMEDAQNGTELDRKGSGGAGAGATGGDVREEGEDAREGGADGGRADQNSFQQQTSDAVRNFLASLNSGSAPQQQQQQQQSQPFTTLPELLPSTSTISMIDAAEPQFIEDLLVKHLPHQLVFLEHQADEIPDAADPEMVKELVQALDSEKQRSIVKRVLRSPQFVQGLQSLTAALRDGGMPTVSEALGIEVENGGYIPGGRMPIGGGDAVEAFLEGIKKASEKEKQK